jgi:hypothetical protein
MRLDPVYLLAPEPEPPSMPTRRAFLLIGGAFLGGTVLGGACGYTIGVAQGGGEQGAAGAGPGEIEWERSDDADLEELRRLAVKAPIGELMEKAVLFLATRSFSYRTDPILFRGIQRLSLEITENPQPAVDPILISGILSAIENGAPPPELNLESLVPALRRARSEARRR